MFKKKFTTLTVLAGLLIVATFSVGTASATTYKASMYGLEETVDSADQRKLRKAFDEVNDREFVKARYQFQSLARSNESVRPFWQSAMYLARSHADLCESWWLETINQGIDHSLSQAELRYLMPLNRHAECIDSVAKTLRKVKSPTPSQAAWLWQQLPEVARYYIPASLTLAKAYLEGFGTEPDLEKSAQWYLATLRNQQMIGFTATRDAMLSLSGILFTLAQEQQSADPMAAEDLYRLSYAYAVRASQGDPNSYLVTSSQEESPLTTADKERLIEQVQACLVGSISQCEFYALPVSLDLKTILPTYLPRDRVVQWLLTGQTDKAFESAKAEARINIPTAWASQLYTSLLTQRYDEALFRLSYLAFEADGLGNDLIAAVASQLDSSQNAEQVIMHAAAAVLSDNAVDAATATRAIDYLDRYVNEASPQALLYLSQVFSRPLTPAYDIDKAIHLANRAFKGKPELAVSLQMARLLNMKSQEEWQEERDAWRLIAIGLDVDNLAGVLDTFDENNVALAAKQLASQCQTAGLTACDLINATESLYNQAWPASSVFVSDANDSTALLEALQTALGQYVALDESQRIDGLDRLMRQYAAPVFVPALATDMQRKYTPSRLAMRYTLLAGALGKKGHWSETIAQQAAILYASNPSSDLERQLGDAYWRAAEDVLLGFPVENPGLAELFYEKAVMTGHSLYAVEFADTLRQGFGLAVDNQRALKLYEYALQQQRKIVIRDLPAYLTTMTDIDEHDTKAYAYALIAYQASFGPILSEQAVEAYGTDLSTAQKAQAQEWATQCIDHDFYFCDIYEPNNTLLYMPPKE